MSLKDSVKRLKEISNSRIGERSGKCVVRTEDLKKVIVYLDEYETNLNIIRERDKNGSRD